MTPSPRLVDRLRALWGRFVRWGVADPAVDAAIARAEAMRPATYFARPLGGEMTCDAGLYITGSSDAAIADRLVRASREVMR